MCAFLCVTEIKEPKERKVHKYTHLLLLIYVYYFFSRRRLQKCVLSQEEGTRTTFIFRYIHKQQYDYWIFVEESVFPHSHFVGYPYCIQQKSVLAGIWHMFRIKYARVWIYILLHRPECCVERNHSINTLR